MRHISNPDSKQFIGKLQPDLSAYVYSTVFGNGSSRPNISPTAFLLIVVKMYMFPDGEVLVAEPDTAYQCRNTGMPVTPDAIKPVLQMARDFYFFVLRRDAAGQHCMEVILDKMEDMTDHVDGGTSRFDQNGVIYQAICANCGGGAAFPTTPGAWATA